MSKRHQHSDSKSHNHHQKIWFDKHDYGHDFWAHHKKMLDHFQDKSVLKKLTQGDYEYREIDGRYNNPEHEYWGSAGSNLARTTGAYYGDDYAPAGSTRPSAREISNKIFDQTESTPEPNGASNMFWLWGQFIDHDIDLSPDNSGESFNIPVPAGDPYFDPFNTGTQEIHFTRSGYNSDTEGREQPNMITAFIDASMVYGSDQDRADFLRTFEGGKLKTSEGELLPYNDGTFDNAGGTSASLFLAGDVRANENVALTSMHTLFVREHNHWAEIIAKKSPYMSDEDIYQRAKMMVEAEIQAITFNEFLPLLLGENAMPEYTGYKDWVDPQIANIFSTAAYRLGHTLLNTTIERFEENGSTIADGSLSLREAFFAPYQITAQGEISSILRGFAGSEAQAVDAKIVDDVRNFLFGPPGAGGLDLASLNIQRGRDHGLPDYNTARVHYGLLPVLSFADITSDPDMQAALAELYSSVNDIDVFVGGLLEDTYQDSMLGELFYHIVQDQFLRLRDGDSHWYEARFDDDMVDYINDISLADIIVRNTDVQYIQEDVMLDYTRIGGTDNDDVIDGTQSSDLLIGLNGNDVLSGLAGNDELFGGDGNDILNGGEGNDRLTGGQGKDTFVMEQNGGDDVITDFKPGQDRLDVSDFDLSPSQFVSNTTQVGSDVLIMLSANSSVTLENIGITELHQQDIIL